MINKIKFILKKSKIISKIYNHYIYRKSDFYKFENSINKFTWNNHKKILKWSDYCLENIDKLENQFNYDMSDQEIVKQSYILKNKVLKEFKNKLKNEKIRFLIHVPDLIHSPGGYSLFINLIDALDYIGIDAKPLYWNDNFAKTLNEYKPNVLITSDNVSYLERFDWNIIREYKKNNQLKIGLTANLPEEAENPLPERLEWAKKNNIDFYYYYSPDEYQIERKDAYKPFFDFGYKILSLEYGFNPVKFYPVPDIEKDLDYVFLGSTNKSKQTRYMEYFSKIFKKYYGFIYGPGWSKINVKSLNTDRDRYIYSRSKVGLNINLKKQIDWAYNLNERTYMLAACGIPQLTDKPKLLLKKFSADSMFIAEDPAQYFELFEYILNNPEESNKRALKSQKQVFTNHTTFHRAQKFILDIKNKIL